MARGGKSIKEGALEDPGTLGLTMGAGVPRSLWLPGLAWTQQDPAFGTFFLQVTYTQHSARHRRGKSCPNDDSIKKKKPTGMASS